MVGSFTSYAERKILLHTTAKQEWTMPTAVWMGLFYEAPTEDERDPGNDTDGVEVLGNGYARVQVTDNTLGYSVFGTVTARGFLQNNGDYDASGDGFVSGSGRIVFDAATDDWLDGPITAAGIFDAAEEGNLIWYGTFAKPKTVLTGDILEFPPNSIQFSLT